MATLPTLTINDPVKIDRIMAAFNSDAAEYKAWLKEQLIERVRASEIQALMDQDRQKYETKRQEFDAFLDDAT